MDVTLFPLPALMSVLQSLHTANFSLCNPTIMNNLYVFFVLGVCSSAQAQLSLLFPLPHVK